MLLTGDIERSAESHLDGAVLVRLAATSIEVQTERRRRSRYWLQ
jgi:beta-lactamase superfamily II metal-dependent hydrolase